MKILTVFAMMSTVQGFQELIHWRDCRKGPCMQYIWGEMLLVQLEHIFRTGICTSICIQVVFEPEVNNQLIHIPHQRVYKSFKHTWMIMTNDYNVLDLYGYYQFSFQRINVPDRNLFCALFFFFKHSFPLFLLLGNQIELRKHQLPHLHLIK